MLKKSDRASLVEREKKFKCGQDWLEVEIFPAHHQPRGRGRTPWQKETCPAQKNLNDKRARKHFVRIAMANFFPGDYRLDLTYNNRFCPTTPEQLHKNGENFIRRLRDLCKRLGLPEPRYLLVNAWGIAAKTGKMVRPHHHLLISCGLTEAQIRQLWRRRGKRGRAYGYVTYVPLQFDPDTGIVGLATYLAEQPTHGRRWHGSRNLIAPLSLSNDSRYSRRRVEKMIRLDARKAFGYDCQSLTHYEDWCKKYPGWRLVGYEPVFVEASGAWYLSLRFKRENEPPGKSKKQGDTQ